MNGQKERILEHLERYGSITQDEAREYYGISRLASRIDELRKAGNPIVTERVDGINRYNESATGRGTGWGRGHSEGVLRQLRVFQRHGRLLQHPLHAVQPGKRCLRRVPARQFGQPETRRIGRMNIKLNTINGKVKYLARTKNEVVGSDTREDTARWMLEQDTPQRSDEFDGFPIAVKVNGTEYFFSGEWLMGGAEDVLSEAQNGEKPRRKKRMKDIVLE